MQLTIVRPYSNILAENGLHIRDENTVLNSIFDQVLNKIVNLTLPPNALIVPN